MLGEFSYRTRERALQRFQDETFDLLVVGGGITGAAVARDATTRGLRVALVERCDFAYGTSSRSSKLIHGGLRYLENFEFHLVFEALAERAFLTRTIPNWVKPLRFYMPVYGGDAHGMGILSLGLWFYDMLALFRTPEFHRRLSRNKLLAEVPFLSKEGLRGGFKYSDASMWDDVLVVETLRAATLGGAAVANYVEAATPLWEGDRISGFEVRDLETGKEMKVRASKTVVCAGPWTDQIGARLDPNWRRWLKASKGVHLLFDLKRIPVPGAMVMSNDEDGRIVFVIPRPDFGPGVVIVGTTDGPTPEDPDRAEVELADIEYLMKMLNRYFPSLKLTRDDILSAYVGVRPLMGNEPPAVGGPAKNGEAATVLQKVSREHHIAEGPGSTVVVAGGKYTTHRKMAEEIVDFTLAHWKKGANRGARFGVPPYPVSIGKSKTSVPLNRYSTAEGIQKARAEAQGKGLSIPEELWSRYGGEALQVTRLADEKGLSQESPVGFPFLGEQLRFTMRNEMVLHLEDFYLRRIPLYAARKDHGLPWANELARIWAEERGLPTDAVAHEVARLEREIKMRSRWEL